MQVSLVASRWEAIANGSGELDMDAAEYLTGFLNILACETIESLKRIENQLISMQVPAHEISLHAFLLRFMCTIGCASITWSHVGIACVSL